MQYYTHDWTTDRQAGGPRGDAGAVSAWRRRRWCSTGREKSRGRRTINVKA